MAALGQLCPWCGTSGMPEGPWGREPKGVERRQQSGRRAPRPEPQQVCFLANRLRSRPRVHFRAASEQ
eukprot:8988653-Alexandrium_andersonii.AAC.1